MLAGAAVSFAGLLGFIGLIVPHFVRRFTGNESGKLLPLCAVAGAGFVTLCDMVSRLLFAPYELPVGILMSVIGGPVFLFLLVRYKGGHRYDLNEKCGCRLWEEPGAPWSEPKGKARKNNYANRQ